MARPGEPLVTRASFQEIKQLTLTGGAWIFALDGTLTIPKHDFTALRHSLNLAADCCLVEVMNSAPKERGIWLSEQIASWEWALSREACLGPGVRSLLEWLTAQKCPIGIVTRNLREVALQTLDTIGLADLIPARWVLGRNESKAKPAPDGIQWLLRQWGHSRSVMVGDYIHDLKAGRAAGAFTIHVGPQPVPAWSA